MIGLGEMGDMLHETGERLDKLERGIKRIEELLGRCLDEGILRTGEEADAGTEDPGMIEGDNGEELGVEGEESDGDYVGDDVKGGE